MWHSHEKKLLAHQRTDGPLGHLLKKSHAVVEGTASFPFVYLSPSFYPPLYLHFNKSFFLSEDIKDIVRVSNNYTSSSTN